MSELSLLTLNIANPSPERAGRQIAWLSGRGENVLVLTETKDSASCRLHADAFTTAGYHVSYHKPENGDYGVMITSKLKASMDDFGGRVGYLPSRTAAITLAAPGGPIHIIGAYVPSRDTSAEKTERKCKWLAACHEALAIRPTGAAVLLGDLNILEPGHQPHYPFFAPFEYDFYRQLTDDCGFIDAFRTLHPDTVEHSWVGRTGDGYRYDHAHCTTDLAGNLLACDYIHQPRLDRLSDHCALSVRLAIDPGELFLPTFRRCSPTSWTARFASRSSSTHNLTSQHLSGKARSNRQRTRSFDRWRIGHDQPAATDEGPLLAISATIPCSGSPPPSPPGNSPSWHR